MFAALFQEAKRFLEEGRLKATMPSFCAYCAPVAVRFCRITWKCCHQVGGWM